MHLELGGKAPVVVLDDADVDAVVKEMRVAAFFNAGRECTAATRIIATPGVHDALIEALVPAAESLRLGEPLADSEVELGPVISARQRGRVWGSWSGPGPRVRRSPPAAAPGATAASS